MSEVTASIPDDLVGLYKAASAYAVATRKTDVECEQISDETLNEIEHEFDVECAFFSKADHRNSDFKPFTVRELIERIAALTQRAELAESRVKELSKPVTDEEWASTAKWPKGVWRDHLDALIAARSPGMSYEEIQAAYDKRIADSALCSGVHRR